MKSKKSMYLMILIIISTLIPIIPIVNSGITYYPDLIIPNISVTDGPLQRHHYITVWVKNQGNWPAGGFHTTLYFQTYNNLTHFGTISILFIHNTPGGLPAGWTIPIPLLPYDHAWTNPDPNHIQCRYYAKVDYYNEVDEGPNGEGNNMFYTPWGP